MGLQLDKKAATEILLREAQLAETEDAPVEWVERIKRFSEIAKESGVLTHVAFLGIAIHAKATDCRVDPFSIKTRSKRPGAYSARSFGDVLASHAKELEINLGRTGREPLQNQPYEKSDEVSGDMVISEAARPVLRALMEVLSELSRIGTEEDARKVLRAYIQVRRGYEPVYDEADFGELGLSISEFAESTHSFVADASERGRRAQAAVAGLLTAIYGEDRVVTGRIHDPDRNLPGDVGVRDADDPERWFMVLEVRDKPVTPSDLRTFAQKALDSGTARAAVVALSTHQGPIETGKQIAYAAEHGLVLAYFDSWQQLIQNLVLWDDAPPAEILQAAHRYVYDNLVAIEATSDAVRKWNEIKKGT